MNIIKLLLVLICFIGIISAQTFNFAFNPTLCGAQENPCKFSDPTNWQQGTVPGDNSNVVIDFTKVTNANKQVFIAAVGINNTFASINIVGTSAINVVVSFQNTNMQVTGGFTGNNSATIVFDNEKSNNVTEFGYDVEVNGKFSLFGSTMQASFSILQFKDIFTDQTSQFSAQSSSSVLINGVAQFWTTVTFTDNSNLIANECFFNAGINSDSRVVVGPTTFYGQSNLEIVTLNNDIIVQGGALTIADSFKYTGNPSIKVTNANLTISGSASATFPTITLQNGNLICFHPKGNFANGVQGNGLITFDINKQGNVESECYLWNVYSASVNVIVAGGLNLFVQNCTFGYLNDKQSSFVINPDHQPTPSVQFDGVNSLSYISTNLTQIVFSDSSMNTLNGPTDSWVQKYPINLLGNLAFNQVNFFGSIDTLDKDSYIGFDGSIVGGTVDLIAGRIHTQSISTIVGDLIMTSGAVLDMDQTSDQFSVGGNLEMDAESTIFIAETLYTDADSLITVNGNLVLNGTLIMDITDTNPSDGDSYNLISCNGATLGTFSTVVPLSSGQATTLDYSVSVSSSGIVSIKFTSKEQSHKKLPGWAVFLIIVAVLGTVAGVAYGYIRYKRRAGYLPINH
ncbi:hypothetical protein ACTFIZ_009283 [Dictyostelium cf. discoideum]